MDSAIHACDKLDTLVREIRRCRICEAHLPLGPRPVIRASSTATILVAGQAPGIRVHQSGIPFDDPSGNRLREWMGIDRDVFYDENKIAIVPMGFCYPGSATRGDLPPRPECVATWHDRLIPALSSITLTLVIGSYAHRYYLGARRQRSLAETVRHWEQYLPDLLPLPHPSPRNNGWLKHNPWFEKEVVPALRKRVNRLLG